MVAITSLLLPVLASIAFAMPVAEKRHEEPSRTVPFSDFFASLGRRGGPNPPGPPNPPSMPDFIGQNTCDISRLQSNLPSAPTPLPAPDSGVQLSHVAIGRGVQLYNCSDPSSPQATPTNVGARASLFNVSCLASADLEFVTWITHAALYYPVPSSSDPNNMANQDLSGHHYFLDPTTPFFNMDTTAHQYGTGAFKKNSTSNAPPTTPPIPLPSNQTGNIAWLKLTEKDPGDGQKFQNVYRLNTAGGSPPATCEGQPQNFEVEYAAQYWLFT